jgi:hypothetical protein
MSDYMDNTDEIIFAEVARGLAALRNKPSLVADGACHYCDEQVTICALFCGVECRDDYDKELVARMRAGRSR